MNRSLVALAFAVTAGACRPAPGASADSEPGRSRSSLLASIDSIVEAPIKAGRIAGASIAVVRGADTIAIKGYGYADLELETPTPPNASYEIGSITKQFTAAAILQLVEQGKLSLDDDVTRLFPGLPLRGPVPIRRLLDHTAGLKSFTPLMPWFHTIGFQTLPRDTVVTLMSREPIEFEPGEESFYSNTGYFLLGLLIERITGQPYDRYVEQNLFAKAGMKDSYYCSERELRKRHAHGYDTGPNGLVQKAYMSHTWPFSAGSLCSTAADLAAWNRALHGGAILGPAMYREMITPDTLLDGTRLRYAKGVILGEQQGHRVMRHDGSIYGFRSADRVYPDDSLGVVVLINTFGPVDPDDLATDIAGLVLRLPPDRGQPVPADVAQLAGSYRRPRGTPMALTLVVADSGRLAIQLPGGASRPLLYRGDDTFEQGDTRLRFVRRSDRVVAVRYDMGYASTLLARQ